MDDTVKLLHGATEEEYCKAAEERILKAASECGDTLSGWTMTAIHAELKTMFDVGKGFSG